MKLSMAAVALMIFSACKASGQPAAAAPAFEVASVKPVQIQPGETTYTANLGTVRHGVVTLTNTTLTDCIRLAYGIATDDQIAGPDWIRSKLVRFNILAKAAPDTDDDQALLMLRTLLEERFKLVLRREQKELSYLALVMGKNGPQMHPAQVDLEGIQNSILRGRIYHNHIAMPKLAYLISRLTRTPVVDMTGLKGFWDVKLEWTPEAPPAASPAALPVARPADAAGGTAAADSPDGPSLFTAVQKQLGLKLESRKGPVEILVVDHAERVPVEN
jgi:uncharacterized protein (TIGR03435 family)